MNCYIADRARADLAEVWLYVARDRPGAADPLYDRLMRHFDVLAANPEMGEDCSKLAIGLRRTSVGNYVVLFRPRSDRVEIVRVIHGARDVEEEFRRHWSTE